MEIPERRIEKAAAKEMGRYSMHHVLFDPAKKQLIATNGRILAVVPVDVDEGDKRAFIPLEVMKAARANRATRVLVNGDFKFPGGMTYPKSDEDNTFPDYEKVIPAGEPTAKVTLNAALLWDLVQAITTKENRTITLSFYGKLDGSEPLALRVDNKTEAFGVIMPVAEE